MVGPVAVRCPRTSRAQAGTWMTWGGDCSSAFAGAAFVALAGAVAFGGASPVAAAESLAGLADELELPAGRTFAGWGADHHWSALMMLW